MKTCTICKQTFELDQFAWKNKAKGTLQTCCHVCRRAAAKVSYVKHKRNVVKAVVQRNKKHIATNVEWKTRLKCACCPESYYRCLDFHHIDPNAKEGEVSKLLRQGTLKRAYVEVQKCVVVCSNCHRKIHGNVLSLTPEIIDRSNQIISQAFAVQNI